MVTGIIGKKVGIGVFGTTADYGMRLGLRKLNLRPNKEVTFIQVGDVPARIAAVTSGAVHAVVLSSFDKHFLEQHGLPTVAYRLCRSVEAARNAYRHFGGRVVVKGCSPHSIPEDNMLNVSRGPIKAGLAP